DPDADLPVSAAGAVPVFLPDAIRNRILHETASARARAFDIPAGSAISDVSFTFELDEALLASTPASRLHRNQYPLSPDALETVSAQVAEWLHDGTVVEVGPNQRFNSPLLVVDKKGGSKRTCCDFRAINAVLRPCTFPIPRVDDMIRWLRGKSVFSVLDLKSGYTQVRVAPESQPITCFTVRHRRYMFQRVPFGLAAAPSLFQRMMEGIVGDLDGVRVYLDDVCVASASPEEHVRHLSALLERLRERNVRLAPSKCAFGLARVELLGVIADGDSCMPARSRIESYAKLSRPTTGRGVSRVLGALNFSRRMIPSYVELAAPIDELRSLRRIPDSAWTPRRVAAWEALMLAAQNPTSLHHPLPDRPFTVFTDASDAAIAGVLGQHDDAGNLRVCDVFSRKLNSAERRYTTAKRELRAVVESLRRFRPFVRNSRCVVCTDNRALVESWSNCLLKGVMLSWLSELFEYPLELRHIAGTSNTLSDSLSRMHSAWELEKILLAMPPPRPALLPLLPVAPLSPGSSTPPPTAVVAATAPRRSARLAARAAAAPPPSSVAGRPGNSSSRSVAASPAVAASPVVAASPAMPAPPAASAAAAAGVPPVVAPPAASALLAPSSVIAPPAPVAPPVAGASPAVVVPPGVVAAPPDAPMPPSAVAAPPADAAAPPPAPAQRRPRSVVLPDMSVVRAAAFDPATQRQVLDQYHTVAHQHGRNLADTISSHGWWWPSLLADCDAWAANCTTCIANRVVQRGFLPARNITASTPFELLAADYFSFAGRSCLLLVDVATRFCIAVSVPDHSGATLARALHSIFSLFGWPNALMSDNEASFHSEQLASL
ncbi:MAG: RNase H-like domain-containing protein, partial [Nitrospira sp.]|nr:RNase H-like domain-containing protein [Nitrospira sp.]